MRRTRMMFGRTACRAGALAGVAALAVATPAGAADDLFGQGSVQSLVSDLRASEVGDILTVVIFQDAQARGSASQRSSRRTQLDGRFRYEGELDPDLVSEGFDLSLGGGYRGTGEVARRETFIAQISVFVVNVLPSGNLVVEGTQSLKINGEETEIGVRGVVRPVDITAENQVLSTRIADAQIEYDGSGFVSRSTRPGVISWLFSVLGLG